MTQKIIWIDTETTGLSAKKNSMVQLAALIDIDGEIVEEIDLFFKPIDGRKIDQAALNSNGRTIKELMAFPDLSIGITNFKKKLARYVNKYDKEDKFVVAGYNVQFDTGFLRESFCYTGDKFYGSWFFAVPIDVYTFVAQAIVKKNLRLPNYKLTTVCAAFDVKLPGAHNAINDIRSTRELYHKLEEYLSREVLWKPENYITPIKNHG